MPRTTQTDRFRAAVVGACNADLETYGLTTDITAWFRHMMADETTERLEETVAKLSPLKRINRCRTPTLVLHGEKDERCPLYHGRAWYVGLGGERGHSALSCGRRAASLS